MSIWLFSICAFGAVASQSVMMSFAWLMQRRTRNTGWIDVVWSFGTGAAAVALALFPLAGSALPNLHQLLAAGAAAFWSLRLGSHLTVRTLRNGDDPRYRALLDSWGRLAQSRLFGQLLVQAVVSAILALSVMVAARAPQPLFHAEGIVALAILVVSIVGEAIADDQLQDFARSNKGGVCDVGLWAWTRHPNYFFEWLFWLAFPILAIAPDYPIGLFSLSAPAIMYWLLVHVSGIPPLEKHMMATRGDSFRSYMMRTNAFFPWPPKRDGRSERQRDIRP